VAAPPSTLRVETIHVQREADVENRFQGEHVRDGVAHHYAGVYSVDGVKGEMEFKATVQRPCGQPKEIHCKRFFNPAIEKAEDTLAIELREAIESPHFLS
jgi:hypothetical protein